jgi:mannose-1-phosphate guanylyltransferase
MLLAAGYGTRLRPLTSKIPKCLVPIDGVPLLGIWLDRLTHSGIDTFLINTHHLSMQVKDYLAESIYSEKVRVVYENDLLGTAGTLISNLDFFKGEDGLLIHADNYCLENFSNFIEAHNKRPKECLITMMTFRTDTPTSCGIVEVDDRGIMIGFHEKSINPPGNLANAAIYIVSSSFIEMASKTLSDSKDFSVDIVSKLSGRIYCYEAKNFFIDIGTPAAYKKACDFVAR